MFLPWLEYRSHHNTFQNPSVDKNNTQLTLSAEGQNSQPQSIDVETREVQ